MVSQSQYTRYVMLLGWTACWIMSVTSILAKSALPVFALSLAATLFSGYKTLWFLHVVTDGKYPGELVLLMLASLILSVGSHFFI